MNIGVNLKDILLEKYAKEKVSVKKKANELYKLKSFVPRTEIFNDYSFTTITALSSVAMLLDEPNYHLLGIGLGVVSVFSTANCIFSKRIKMNRDLIKQYKKERDDMIASVVHLQKKN